MKAFSWIWYALVAATTTLAYEAPTKLITDTTYSPPECPQKATPGSQVNVHYTGTLHQTGAKFDSSLDRGQPLGFTLGSGQVIKGWDRGIEGMCVKEKRKLTIPAELAYGSRGFGSIIPPDAALVFDVELVSLDSGSRDEL